MNQPPPGYPPGYPPQGYPPHGYPLPGYPPPQPYGYGGYPPQPPPKPSTNWLRIVLASILFVLLAVGSCVYGFQKASKPSPEIVGSSAIAGRVTCTVLNRGGTGPMQVTATVTAQNLGAWKHFAPVTIPSNQQQQVVILFPEAARAESFTYACGVEWKAMR